MLSSAALRDHLRTFADARYAGFAGFPTTRDQARERWAAAFDAYIATIEEQIPRPPPPPDQHPSISLAGVKDAFRTTVQLTDGIAVPAAAFDFADAWKASIGAIVAGGAATDSAGGTYAWLSFSNVTTLHATLESTLAALFVAPTIDIVTRLGAIADAFHAATSGLLAAVTYTNPSGVSSPLALGFR